MSWKIAIAAGVTVFLVVFAWLSGSDEDVPFETALGGGLAAGVAGGGLVLLWGWALG